jgi:hypothetical protein
MLWLDTKFVSLLSFRLRNFKRKGNDQWNFSCPFCGDSKTNKHKARGYIFERKGKLRFFCHNCNVPGIDVPKLVKHLDPMMYDEYLKEKLMADPAQRPKTDVELFADKMKPPVFMKSSPLAHLKKISLFKPTSTVKMWVNDRMLPPESHYRLFFCREFKQWVNEYCIPGKFDEDSLTRDEPRLIIPFLDNEGNLFGFQGRSFKKNASVRYITIMLDNTKPKIFGLDKVDVNLPHIYVVEGALDSLFVKNSVAVCQGDLSSALRVYDKEKLVFIPDRDIRNPQVMYNTEKLIDKGCAVCFLPDNFPGKDINEAIINGMTNAELNIIIQDNIYKDLEAKMRFISWKKC